MVDWDGLENRCGFTLTVGSNPTLSAIGQEGGRGVYIGSAGRKRAYRPSAAICGVA